MLANIGDLTSNVLYLLKKTYNLVSFRIFLSSEYFSYIVHTIYVSTARKRLELETEKLQMKVCTYLETFQMHLSITTKVSWEKTGVLKVMFITLFRAVKSEGAVGQLSF